MNMSLCIANACAQGANIHLSASDATAEVAAASRTGYFFKILQPPEINKKVKKGQRTRVSPFGSGKESRTGLPLPCGRYFAIVKPLSRWSSPACLWWIGPLRM
jgi:hypothetical protein